jgi:lipopolysaccharide transport system permease protein
MATLDFGLARWDLMDGVGRFDLAWGMAVRDLQARYARSFLGPAWITLTMAIYVGVVGFVFGALFGADIREMVPWIAMGMIAWTFLSNVLLESSTVLDQNRSLMLQARISVSTLVLVVVLRNFLIVGHHLAIFVVLVAIGFVPLSFNALLAIPGVILAGAFAFGLGLVAAILGARYRDLPPLFGSLVTLGLLASPVMWRPGDLQRFHLIADYNPLAHLIAIFRDPMLGRPIDLVSMGWAAASAAVVVALGTLILARGRRTITFWI